MDDVAFSLRLADGPGCVVDLFGDGEQFGREWPLLFGITPTNIGVHGRLTVAVHLDLNAKTDQCFSECGDE
jgi:hypothetical protein